MERHLKEQNSRKASQNVHTVALPLLLVQRAFTKVCFIFNRLVQ